MTFGRVNRATSGVFRGSNCRRDGRGGRDVGYGGWGQRPVPRAAEAIASSCFSEFASSKLTAALASLQCGCESVEGEGAEEIAAHAAFDIGEPVGSGSNPGEVGVGGELLQFTLDVGIADELRGVGVE